MHVSVMNVLQLKFGMMLCSHECMSESDSHTCTLTAYKFSGSACLYVFFLKPKVHVSDFGVERFFLIIN